MREGVWFLWRPIIPRYYVGGGSDRFMRSSSGRALLDERLRWRELEMLTTPLRLVSPSGTFPCGSDWIGEVEDTLFLGFGCPKGNSVIGSAARSMGLAVPLCLLGRDYILQGAATFPDLTHNHRQLKKRRA